MKSTIKINLDSTNFITGFISLHVNVNVNSILVFLFEYIYFNYSILLYNIMQHTCIQMA